MAHDSLTIRRRAALCEAVGIPPSLIAARANPSLPPTRYGWLRQPPRAGDSNVRPHRTINRLAML
jgi:hypothetical protein